jgi:hypothetical protein
MKKFHHELLEQSDRIECRMKTKIHYELNEDVHIFKIDEYQRVATLPHRFKPLNRKKTRILSNHLIHSDVIYSWLSISIDRCNRLSTDRIQRSLNESPFGNNQNGSYRWALRQPMRVPWFQGIGQLMSGRERETKERKKRSLRSKMTNEKWHCKSEKEYLRSNTSIDKEKISLVSLNF